MKIYFLFKTFYRILFYYFSSTKRYINLLILILKFKPKTILEIGVYNGSRAKQMIEAAKIFQNEILYYGFDLFEMMIENHKLKDQEFSKFPLHCSVIKQKLLKVSQNIFLYKGYTQKTLKKFHPINNLIEYIFIDGGHSTETIKSDWKNIQKYINKNTIVIFDDYYVNYENLEILKKVGCNKVISQIDKKKYLIQKLPFTDIFFKNNKKIGIRMISVKLK